MAVWVFAPLFAEVDPGGVHFLDKGELFCAGPTFELLFAGNGAAGVVIALVVDETVAVVVRGEAFEILFLCSRMRGSMRPVTPM